MYTGPIPTDLAGNPRFLYNNVDIGAYEYAGVDYDLDGIPNVWEKRYFAGITNCVPDAGNDSDPFSNLEEYIAGTDPTDTASYFHITNCTATADRFLVEWNAVSGRTYSIWQAPSLTNDFVLLTNSIAWPQSSCTFIPDGTNGFYRVQVELP